MIASQVFNLIFWQLLMFILQHFTGNNCHTSMHMAAW